MKNLEKALFNKKIPDKFIANMLGVTEKTLRNKMQGITEFTVAEARKIKDLFPEYDTWYLFERDNESA